jgi:hypothetical protein
MGGGYYSDRWQRKMERLQDKMERLRGPGDWWGCHSSSGNRAFDEYRADTLKRLEDEQREFRDFLARLRQAKDKAEFDQFMAERRNRPAGAGFSADLSRVTPQIQGRPGPPRAALP